MSARLRYHEYEARRDRYRYDLDVDGWWVDCSYVVIGRDIYNAADVYATVTETVLHTPADVVPISPASLLNLDTIEQEIADDYVSNIPSDEP